jgi:ABC-2 type transport system permease protein
VAFLLSVLLTLLPVFILSGFVFPLVIQAVTYVFPLRWCFVIIRGLFLKGVGLEQLWKESAALAGIGLVVIAGSVLRFRKRLE